MPENAETRKCLEQLNTSSSDVHPNKPRRFWVVVQFQRIPPRIADSTVGATEFTILLSGVPGCHFPLKSTRFSFGLQVCHSHRRISRKVSYFRTPSTRVSNQNEINSFSISECSMCTP